MNKYDNMADTVINWVKKQDNIYPEDWLPTITDDNIQRTYDLIIKNPDMTLEEFRKLTQQEI